MAMSLTLILLTTTAMEFPTPRYFGQAPYRARSHTFLIIPSGGGCPWPFQQTLHDHNNDGVQDVGCWTPFGLFGDQPLTGDTDGDHKSDLIVFRRTAGTRTWVIKFSGGGGEVAVPFGAVGDIPDIVDINGDGISDLAMYAAPIGNTPRRWRVRIWYQQDPVVLDVPAFQGTYADPTEVVGARYASSQAGGTVQAANYFRITNGPPYNSATGVFQWVFPPGGVNGHGYQGIDGGPNLPSPPPFFNKIPVAENYGGTAQNLADFMLWDPSTHVWQLRYNGGAAGIPVTWGANGDIPVGGNYESHFAADPTLWRPVDGTWWTIPSGGYCPWYSAPTGYSGGCWFQWGLNGDIPLGFNFARPTYL